MTPASSERFSQPDHQFRAMGSQIEFWLDKQPGDDLYPIEEAEALFHQYEAVFSRFRPDSELSRINKSPGRPIQVSPLMGIVLDIALHACRVTHGAFDCTLSRALEQAGYAHSFEPGQSANFAPDDQVFFRGRWQEIQFDPFEGMLLLPPGVKLDLGGIVKGYTAQQALNILSDHGPALVNAGGDIVSGLPPAGYPGWPVEIESPFQADGVGLYKLWVQEAGVATSGIDYRHWSTNGGPMHHIIDPRTGLPAETDIESVTILSGNIEMGEAWATAAIVMGLDEAFALFESHTVAASFVTRMNRLHLTSAMQHHVYQKESIE